ncbi:hypothetical protein AGLY_000437 [Aphis glycines]|uniref:Uncharacterized protein n=1 Tax=Aphis glycines TaxID=307491 RepID=A0A6G0U743_APHGL|nr:hypothetical protein AGLY_000437 [Aphis glycines]
MLTKTEIYYASLCRVLLVKRYIIDNVYVLRTILRLVCILIFWKILKLRRDLDSFFTHRKIKFISESSCDGFVIDYGFNFSSNLEPSLRIEILRWFDANILESVIKYGAIIWNSHTTAYIYVSLCYKVQRRFLIFKCTLPDYTPVATQLGLASLTKHRYILVTNFLKGPLDIRFLTTPFFLLRHSMSICVPSTNQLGTCQMSLFDLIKKNLQVITFKTYDLCHTLSRDLY